MSTYHINKKFQRRSGLKRLIIVREDNRLRWDEKGILFQIHDYSPHQEISAISLSLLASENLERTQVALDKLVYYGYLAEGEWCDE